MNDTRIPLGTAMATTRSNPQARPPTRGGENRLEPECWPELAPSFTFGKSDGIFVIGSCFATNIENYLGQRDYRLLSRVVSAREIAPGHLNKYTPASIHQEVAWARRIHDRDDCMTEADAMEVMFDCGDGTFIDTQLHVFEPKPREEAIARRAIVYRTYRELFAADVVVITLGLIEAWWDDVLKIYIQETPSRQMMRHKDRFFFERLSFSQCKRFLEETIALIQRDRKPNFLITTSPVSLARTYTDEDVLIANMQSKSVLRAVTGEVCAGHANIDYFPSYESVMLTRSPSVWQDDLTHVSERFIQRIMMRVESRYTEGFDDSAIAAADDEGRFVDAVQGHDLDGAWEAYQRLADPLSNGSSNFHTLAAIVAAKRGDAVLARQHLEAPVTRADGAGLNLLEFVRYSAWKRIGEQEHGLDWLKKHFANGQLYRAPVIHKSVRWLMTEGDTRDAVEILEAADPTRIRQLPLLNRFADILKRHDRPEHAARFQAQARLLENPADAAS